MAYFNNAFNKTFVATGVVKTASTATSALTAGQLALVDGSDWESVAVTGGGAVPVIAAGDLAYVVPPRGAGSAGRVTFFHARLHTARTTTRS